MAEQTTHTLPLREEVPAKDKWHIEDIFSNDDAFTSALEACRTHIDALAAFKDHLGDSAETLCTYLTEKEKVLVELDSLYCYAGHRSDEDTSNPHYQDLRGQVDFTGNHFYETTAFEDPELLSLPEDFIPEALKNYSELIPFTHYLENTLRLWTWTAPRSPFFICSTMQISDLKVSQIVRAMKSASPTDVSFLSLKVLTGIFAAKFSSPTTVPLTSIKTLWLPFLLPI